jgi:hypothetical protein
MFIFSEEGNLAINENRIHTLLIEEVGKKFAVVAVIDPLGQGFEPSKITLTRCNGKEEAQYWIKLVFNKGKEKNKK